MRGDDDGAAVGHGVSCVHRKVKKRKLQLVRVGRYFRQAEGEAGFDLNRGAKRALQQVRHPAHKVRDVDGLEMELLLAGKGQHALRQLRPALRALHRIVQKLGQHRIFRVCGASGVQDCLELPLGDY
jgi:hypothetical protein